MSKYNLVRDALKKKYTDLEVKEEVVPGNTGSFEVILSKNGKDKLVHSKMSGEGIINANNLDAFLAIFDKAYKNL